MIGGKRFGFLSSILKKSYPDLHVLTLNEKYITTKDYALTIAVNTHYAGMFPRYPISRNDESDRLR